MSTIDTKYNLKEVLRSILFVAGEGVEKEYLAEKLDITMKELEKAVCALEEECSGDNGLHLIRYKNKIQLSSNPNFADYISDDNKSVLFSTHITADLERIADYITILNNGKVWFTGTKDEIMEKYAILKGDENYLTENIKKKIIGFHSYKNGFEAMLPTEFLNELPEEIEYEKANIDEILVYMSKEAANERNS